MDLFFYREPEEAKEQEEDEAPAVDYPDYTAGAMGGIQDQWSSQITDAQWNQDGAPAIPAVPGVGWNPDASGEMTSPLILTILDSKIYLSLFVSQAYKPVYVYILAF